MRSRYAAYATGRVDYVVASHNPATRDQVDESAAKQWSESASWEGLEVHNSKTDGDDGHVEFTARYSMKGQHLRHRELAVFRKIDGRWMYHDGEMVKPKPVTREAPKVGRNDPCSCGSGKKYKKCHGA